MRRFEYLFALRPIDSTIAPPRRVMDKTGNAAAVQRPPGHKNAACSLQYAWLTSEELREVLNDWGSIQSRMFRCGTAGRKQRVRCELLVVIPP